MNNKTKLILLLFFLVQISFATEKQKQQPNILLFIADDCTFRDLGCYGGIDAKTPTIDAFAKEGMQFFRCFQATAMCSPTRTCLYTGLYPVKSGGYPNSTFVKEGTQSIVQYMAPKGYKSALLGKTHISPQEAFPFEYLGDDMVDDLDFDLMDRFLSGVKEKGEPFCLFVCSHQPHLPYTKGDPSQYDPGKVTLPPYFVDTEETRASFIKYLAEIDYMDDEFKTCLELLDKYGFSENTIVIFTSEQGNSFPFAKWTCYGNGLQSAFLVRWPEVIKPGSTSDAMIEYVDVGPTYLDIAGIDIPDYLEGKSFLPVLKGEKNEHKKYVYGVHTTRGIMNGSEYYGIRTVSSADFRYVLNLTPEATFQNNLTVDPVKGVVFNSWKEKGKTDEFAKSLSYKYQHRPAEELYDLNNDPYEMNNIASNPKYADIKKELRDKLYQWMDQQGDKGQQTEMEALEHVLFHR
nr:sulfatase [uncultured Draconibacterium sp.]